MKNMQGVVFVLVALFAQTVSADLGRYCPGLGCYGPPQAPLTYQSAEETFRSGFAPWPTDLVGSWTVMGSTQNPMLYPMEVVTEETNPNGVALDPMHEGVTGTLVFTQSHSIEGTHDIQVRLVVVDRNTGTEVAALDQGPMVVSIGRDEACFGLEYGRPAQIPGVGTRSGYINYSCRTLRDSNLICAMLLNSPVYGYGVTGYALLSPSDR